MLKHAQVNTFENEILKSKKSLKGIDMRETCSQFYAVLEVFGGASSSRQVKFKWYLNMFTVE